MLNVDKNALINNLCQKSGLEGAALSEYKARLSKMSAAELTALISGNNTDNNTDTVEFNNTNTTNTPIDKSTAQDLSIENIESNANQALEMVSKQDDGVISKTYNDLKEKFYLGLPKSKVEEVIYKQFKTAEYLKKAKANNLTYAEYFDLKRGFLMGIFPGVENLDDKQKEMLKNMISSLSMDELLEQQDKILNLPDKDSPEYQEAMNKFFTEFKEKTTDTIATFEKNDFSQNMKIKTEPKAEYKPENGDRLMTFDEVYMLEQGVEFNKDNIQKSNESAATFTLINNVKAKKDKVHEILHDNLRLVEGNNALGATKEIQESSNQRLEISILSALNLMYGPDLEKQNAALKELAGEGYVIENGQIKSNSQFQLNESILLPDIAHKILDKVDSNYNKLLGGKTLEDYAQEMADSYTNAYGKKDASALASSYVQEQEGVVKNVRTGVEIVGSAVMFGGMFFFPPAALAGGALASFGGVGVEMYNEMTKEHASQEKIDELKKELATNGLLMGIGMGAGKVGNSVKTMLTAKNAPKLLAMVGDVGADATISLLGDLALTGQINLEGEGLSQVMSLIAGHRGKIVKGVQALKENFKAKYGPDAKQMPDGTVIRVNQDGSTTVLEEGNNNRNIHPNDQVNHINQPDEGIPTIKQENTLSSTLSYKEIFENKKTISTQEANNILRKYNLTEADIAEIRNTVKDSEALNAYINAIDIVSKYEGDMNYNEMSVKEIKESLLDIESDSEQIEVMKLINPDNLQQIQHMFKTEDDKESIELLVKLWEESQDNPDYEKVWNKSVEIFNQTGAPFKDIFDRFASAYKYYPEEIEQLTPERIIANGQITQALGTDYYFGAALSIKDPSKITPEFIQEFKVEHDKLKNLNIDTNYNDPVEALAEFKKISEFSKKYGFDFSWNKKETVSRESILKLLALKDPSEAKGFINNISEEFKDKYANYIMRFATREDVLTNSQDYVDFFNYYAQIESFAHMPSNASSPTSFISELNNIGVKDIGGVAKMLEAFNEVNAYPSWHNFFEAFNIKDDNYEAAAEYIKSLPEIFKDNSYSGGMKNSVENYITYNWKPDVDFKIANERVKALKEKNLTFDMDKNILQTIVSSKNDDIVDIFALLKDYGVSYDGAINAILSNDNLSVQMLQEKIDVITNKLIAENPGSENIDPKFLQKLINSKTHDNYTLAGLVNNNWDINSVSERYGFDLGGDIDIKYNVYSQHKDKFNTPELIRTLLEVNNGNVSITKLLYSDDEYSDRMISNILGATNNQNVKLAEKLCLDKEFPRNYIPEILLRTNGQNIAIAEKLCSDKDFPKDKVSFIVSLTNEQNMKMTDFLYENKDFPPDKIADVIKVINEENMNYAKSLCADKDFPKESIPDIVQNINNSNVKYAEQLLTQYKNKEISISQFSALINNTNSFSYKDIQRLRRIIGRTRVDSMNETDLTFAAKFSSLLGKQNINEIPIEEKRGLLRKLVANNIGLFEISDDIAKDFPLIPRNQEESCTLLPALVRSLGVDVTPLRPEIKVENFNKSMSNLSQSLAKLSDNDFANITITQEYSKDDFIKTVLDKVKDLSREERQKVYDYYGFELHHNKGNKETGFSITGYPVNLNNGKKLDQITDSKTKEVVESLRSDVIRFSENNPIKSNNPEVEQLLNEIVEALPELRTTIGKGQHSTHDFDIMQHSLKVMQKITQDPKFNELNESDKKIMMLASLMHDIRKREGFSDPTHADESSFDTFFIGKKFNLSKNEEIKLYTLIKHHEWLQYVNTARDYDGNISPIELEKRLQSVAYDLQQDNLFDMAMMFTHADLKAVKTDNRFHDTTIGKGRIDETGKPTSYGDLADIYATKIKKYVAELQKSQPLLPVTKIPTSSVMRQAITHVNSDGSTNLKGVYVDKDGLVILKYNEVEDWEALGFPKGSISRGISAKGLNNNGQETDVDTGNIKFFVHGLDYANQLAKFDAFGLVDSDVLLSVSYAERPESKYRFFRTQGVILDVDTKYIHGGGNTDSGSGCGKSIADFKKNYIFGGYRESDRLYISNMIKEATGMSDSEYVRFVKENENKPFTEIEPEEVREKIIKAFATINSNVRKGNREYNEMYASNPNVMGVFAYSPSNHVGDVMDFVQNNSTHLDFLKKFAIERDIPMIVFGD